MSAKNTDKLQQFNDLEAIKLAITIEENGYEFYKTHAAKATDPKIKKILTDLMHEEEQHIAIFRQVEGELAAERQDQYQDDPSVGSYIGAIIKTNIFSSENASANYLKIATSKLTPLQIAACAEKDAILFYLEAAQRCQNPRGKEVFFRLANEEKRHLSHLSSHLQGCTP